MTTVFDDTNVFLRHLLGDHVDHSPRATAFFVDVASGKLSATTAASAIMEVVFVLERTHKVPRAEIASAISQLVTIEHIRFADKAAIVEALDSYSGMNVPFVDALHVALSRAGGITRIASFDRHFDRFPGIERVEP